MQIQLKIVSAALAACTITLALAGCGSTAAGAAQSPASAVVPSTAASAADTAESETPAVSENTADAESGNILIVYFSVTENTAVDAIASASVMSDTGRGVVATIADTIQSVTGGTEFSILTSTVYPGDIDGVINQGATERNENFRPELTSHIDNLDGYDTIFIGYPNWWGDMPMVLYSFFEEYDFTGKTIIPFSVHRGSQFSRTISTIQDLEPGATVRENGFTVNHDTVTEGTANDVTAWLNELGY